MTSEEQIEKAWHLIDQEELEEARAIGQDLVNNQVEEGYRIIASSWEWANDWETAFETLEKGVEAMPESWQLWLSLGNMQSNLENYDAAFESYQKAEACEGAETHWISLNKALAHARIMEFDDALNTLQSLSESEIKNHAFLLKLQLLSQLGRDDLILELVEEELEDLDVPSDEESAKQMGHICALIAGACWNEEEDEPKTMYYLEQAIHYDRTNEEAIWLIREMNPDFSDEAKMYSLVVQGLIMTNEADKQQKIPFFTTYEIVADSEEEALEFVKLYEVREIDRDSLKIMEVEIDDVDEESDDAKGIYAVGGFAFFDESGQIQSSE